MIGFLSLLHALYIIYVLNYFKTTYNFAHPITYFTNSLIHHPIGMSSVPKSKVCRLGKILSWYLALFIFLRGVLLEKKLFVSLIKKVSLVVLVIAIAMSMMNFNVVLYLIPHFIIEVYIVKYL